MDIKNYRFLFYITAPHYIHDIILFNKIYPHTSENSFIFVYLSKPNNFILAKNEKITQPFFIKAILLAALESSERSRGTKIKRINENLRHKF